MRRPEAEHLGRDQGFTDLLSLLRGQFTDARGIAITLGRAASLPDIPGTQGLVRFYTDFLSGYIGHMREVLPSVFSEVENVAARIDPLRQNFESGGLEEEQFLAESGQHLGHLNPVLLYRVYMDAIDALPEEAPEFGKIQQHLAFLEYMGVIELIRINGEPQYLLAEEAKLLHLIQKNPGIGVAELWDELFRKQPNGTYRDEFIQPEEKDRYFRCKDRLLDLRSPDGRRVVLVRGARMQTTFSIEAEAKLDFPEGDIDWPFAPGELPSLTG